VLQSEFEWRAKIFDNVDNEPEVVVVIDAIEEGI